jgi:hypothetical protein
MSVQTATTMEHRGRGLPLPPDVAAFLDGLAELIADAIMEDAAQGADSRAENKHAQLKEHSC